MCTKNLNGEFFSKNSKTIYYLLELFKSFVNLSLLKLYTTTYILLLLILLHNNNDNCHLLDHDPNMSKSLCDTCLFSLVLYKSVSSAKRRHSDVMLSGRSFTYNKKKRGPRTEPCGTPDNTSQRVDAAPLTITV